MARCVGRRASARVSRTPARPDRSRSRTRRERRLVLGTKEQGVVAAFDRASGATRWRVDFPGTIVTAPQVDATAGIAVVAWHKDGAEGHVRALDLGTGATRWEVATMEKLAAPVAHAGLVVLSEGDNYSHARIRAVDAATGAPRWETAVPKSFEWETEPGAAGDDYATVDHFGTVTVVDVHTGEIRWQHVRRLGAPRRPGGAHRRGPWRSTTSPATW